MTDRYYPDIVDDNLEMLQAIQRVRELHFNDYGFCGECNLREYPCQTIKTLDGEQ